MARPDLTRTVAHIPDTVTFRGNRYGVISGTSKKTASAARKEANRISKNSGANTIVVQFNLTRGGGTFYWVAGRFQ